MEISPKPKVITSSVLKFTVTLSLLEITFLFIISLSLLFHTRDLGTSDLQRAHNFTITSLVYLRVSSIFQPASLYLVNNIIHFFFFFFTNSYEVPTCGRSWAEMRHSSLLNHSLLGETKTSDQINYIQKWLSSREETNRISC